MTNGITVTVDGASYHSLDDWGLAISNNNCVGDPVATENIVTVPGLSKVIDLSDIFGSVSYQYRPISINFGGLSADWPAKLQTLRGILNGKVIQLIFDDDPDYYWTGRCYVSGYDRFRKLGTFALTIPKADPFKYATTESTKDITASASGTTSIITNNGHRAVIPYVKNTSSLTITNGATTISISASTSWKRYTAFQLQPGTNSVTFTGSGTVNLRWQEVCL